MRGLMELFLLYAIMPLLLMVILLLVFFRVKKVKYKKTILFILATYIFLGYAIYFMYWKIDSLNYQLASATRYEIEFAAQNTKLKEENLVMKLTLEQMEYYMDSLMTKVIDLNREIRIKDSQIHRLQNR